MNRIGKKKRTIICIINDTLKMYMDKEQSKSTPFQYQTRIAPMKATFENTKIHIEYNRSILVTEIDIRIRRMAGSEDKKKPCSNF